MFNFTTTLSYGLRLLVNLALEDKYPKQLRKIAKEENISLYYLRKLVPSLERAGFIKGLKGPGGGFILSRKPNEITLLEITNILSRNRIIDCLKDPSNCGRYDDCLVKDVWEEIYDKTQGVFKNKTLETVIKRRRK